MTALPLVALIAALWAVALRKAKHIDHAESIALAAEDAAEWDAWKQIENDPAT